MSGLRLGSESRGERPRFYSVAEVARMFGMSKVTVYRAIADGDFPAVRIRGRLIVPAKAVEAMVEAAVSAQSVVDVAAWPAEGA
jgi:excisionase family DNA binding protein